MRAAAEIASVDTKAERIGYVEPPADLVPTGNIGEDDTWSRLAEWYHRQGINFDSAIQVYISRRFDEPPNQVYAMTDSWAKSMWKRFNAKEEAAEREAMESDEGFRP